MTLLALHDGDRVQRTWAAQDHAKDKDISIKEVEHQINIRLFLDEYPWWGLRTPH